MPDRSMRVAEALLCVLVRGNIKNYGYYLAAD